MSNTAIRTAVIYLAATGLTLAAAPSKSPKRLTPERIAELTAPADAARAKAYTVAISGLYYPSANPGQAHGRQRSEGQTVTVTLPAGKPEGILESIREFRFPSAFKPPEAEDGGARGVTAPTVPTAFETVNTGWTIRLSARPHGKLVGLSGVADFTDVELLNGGYGPLSGPISTKAGKLLSPNVVHQPKFQTTSTRFHIFAVPGDSYEVTLYRGAKAEKHLVTLTAE